MPEAESGSPEVLWEATLLLAQAMVATYGASKAQRFLEEVERRASLQERLTSTAPLRSSPPAALKRTVKREAASVVLAVLPLLASCVPPG